VKAVISLYVHLLRIDHLAIWEWPGSGPPILFTHATGFHGRLWDRVIEHFPHRRCLAIDLRGHGRSGKDLPSYAWKTFGEDTALVANRLELRETLGVGHSLGGHAMALAAALEPASFSGLLLIDPVIQASDRYDSAPTDVGFIARRRSRWKSAEEMYQRFSARPPFSAWKPEILRDYCEYGLLPDGDEFVLACPPQIEASIYPAWNHPDADISAELATIQQPTTILRSGTLMTREKFDLSTSATDPNLASRMPNAVDVYLEGSSHFIPMENPELVINWCRTNT
jgi:pimeloyl-ACP methyl ester carboxylesterase